MYTSILDAKHDEGPITCLYEHMLNSFRPIAVTEVVITTWTFAVLNSRKISTVQCQVRSCSNQQQDL